MRIKEIRVRRLTGTMAVDGVYLEDRLVRPVDVYKEYRTAQWPYSAAQIDKNRFRIVQCFLEIQTDSGVVGRAGPVWPDAARLILTQLRTPLIGRDALATELLWDQLHRLQVHGRQGDAMLALSAVDCALWDIKGKVFGQPVWRILGGATRSEMPAYVSMLGYAVEDMGLVRERALAFKEKGFTGQKWFFRHGPMSGHEGMKLNVALVQTLRETLGYDYDIMLDAWQSLNFDYAVDLCSRIEDYRPRWLEEPFMPDRIDSYVKLKAKTRIPLAGAEHDYTRWGMKRFIEKGALDIIQADTYWCGGLSELMKIAAYTTTEDLILIPHGHMTAINIHFSLSQSPIHTPYQEYLVKWNEMNMYFLKNPLWAVNGSIPVPTAAGVDMDIDSTKIESEDLLST